MQLIATISNDTVAYVNKTYYSFRVERSAKDCDPRTKTRKRRLPETRVRTPRKLSNAQSCKRQISRLNGALLYLGVDGAAVVKSVI